MGRYLPWRKTVTLLFVQLTLSSIFSEPIISRTHKPMWKGLIESNGSEIIETKNNYKKDKIYDINDVDPQIIERGYKQLSKENWVKYLNITYNRLLPYLDFISKEVESQGAPLELIYLPIIESAANPNAISPRGAAGLWQFMSNSSGAYDMVTTDWIDERMDFVKSTKGAISKLSYNYKVTGDWLLALAAYNCGLNRVKSVIKQSGINDYWELSKRGLLPRETINYIPKLLVVSRLLQEKNSYNIPIKWDTYNWEEIPLNQAVDLRLLSQKANVPLKVLQDGNRELLYSVTPPVTSDYKLKIPTEYKEHIEIALNSQENLMEFYRYKVKSGDTLSEIGYYYGISTPNLIKYNPGVSPRTLRIGKTLIVPAIKKIEPYEKKVETRVFKNSYIVKNGDTLWDISLVYNTTIEELALNNGLSIDDYLKDGMKLKVP